MSEEEYDNELSKLLAGDYNDSDFEQSESQEDVQTYLRILKEMDTWKLPIVNKADGYQKLKYQLVDAKKEDTKVISISSRWLGLVAASISLLVVSFWLFFMGGDEVRIQTAFGEIKEVEFPDGSMAKLGSNTTISYASESWSTNPTVSLIHGEAYFYGEHSKGFQIATNNVEVTVLGTQFNVKSMGEHFSVNCYEGRLEVTKASSSSEILSSGEYLRLDQDGSWMRGLEDAALPSWIDGQSSKFKNATLSEVFETLKNQFDVELILDKDLDLDRKFTGSFLHSHVEVALKMICEPLNLKYEMIDQGKYTIYQ